MGTDEEASTDAEGNPAAGGTAPPPILRDKRPDAPSVFVVENLMREARRQRRLPERPAPPLCLLDPDGDIADHLLASGRARRDEAWPCYHSSLFAFEVGGVAAGVVPRAVGAPYAVLVAEQLFAAGCRLLVSITSAGRLAPLGPPPYFVLAERALRDEGTSYHYLPPSDFAEADPVLLDRVWPALERAGPRVVRGGLWTTDAPFRETAGVIEAGGRLGLAAIEMETAALHAFAAARRRPVVCLAHVTNVMAAAGDDFEKGEAGGARDALRLLEAVARAMGPVLDDPPGPDGRG